MPSSTRTQHAVTSFALIVLGLAAGLSLSGCVGEATELTAPGATGPGSDQVGEDGDTTCQLLAPKSSMPLRRLSRAQYLNTLTDVVRALAPGVADAVLAAPAVQAGIAQLRADNRVTGAQSGHGGFRRLDQQVEQSHVEAIVTIAQAVASELTNTNARIGSLLGACATDGNQANDPTCVSDFINRAGRLAHRRALDADDLAFYVSVYAAQGIDAAGLADLVTVMLSGPYFFYQVEHGGDAIDAAASRYALDAQELANRLSAQFWNSMPDATLQGMVDSGAIATDSGYGAALSYVMASPRVVEVYAEFFREFFSAEDLPEIDRFVGTPAFDAARGSFLPTADTREHMIDEVTRLATYYASRPDGVFADLLTTKKSFATTQDVAALYGAPTWSGTGEPPDMPDAQRVGILTHAAMVATGSPTTRPILKGVYIRGALLCDELPAPPANAMQVAQDVGASLPVLTSTRARIEAITARADCASCHKQIINPLGFLTEGFDSLGRVRQMEKIFDQSGAHLGDVAIDTASVPAIVPNDPTVAAGPADLAQLLVASKKPQACMATKYYRFSLAQLEDKTNEACLISTLKGRFGKGQSLGSVLSDLALMPSFRQRVIE